MNLNYKFVKSIIAVLILLAGVSLNAYACPLHDGEGAKATGENSSTESSAPAPQSVN